MEQSLRMRIQDVLALKHYSINKLAGVLGVAMQVKLNNQISKTTTISAQTVMLVLSTFPDVSAEWLLRGEGSILKEQTGTIINNAHTHIGTANAGSTTMVQDQTQLIAAKDELIAELRKDKENLMTLLTTLTNK